MAKMHVRSGLPGREAFTARQAAILLFGIDLLAAPHAQALEPGEFGAVSPTLNECFQHDTLPPGCQFEESEVELPSWKSPIRLSGEARMGFDHDGDRVVPVHDVEIQFQAGFELGQ